MPLAVAPCHPNRCSAQQLFFRLSSTHVCVSFCIGITGYNSWSELLNFPIWKFVRCNYFRGLTDLPMRKTLAVEKEGTNGYELFFCRPSQENFIVVGGAYRGPSFLALPSDCFASGGIVIFQRVIFFFEISGFSHCILEVNTSNRGGSENQPELWGMTLQASCLARLGNKLRKKLEQSRGDRDDLS
ncbi:hypothetical protein BJV74DRAFT_404046 [Russula compacta]|nr:hypothetical protein BJV74DRAFT_404046 [Russula compacta]